MEGGQFQIESHGVTLTIERLKLAGDVAFRVVFSSGRPAIVIARAIDFDSRKFWTSIPEGRQKEAEGVGLLIEKYLESKK